MKALGICAAVSFLVSCGPKLDPCALRSVEVGVDLSSLPSLSNVSLTDDHEKTDVWTSLEDGCVGLVRIRLWHSPSSSSGSLAEVQVLAQQAKSRGMKVLLALHASDTWADPASQSMPQAWVAGSTSAQYDSLSSYVARAVQAVDPDVLQLGNETNNGWVWPLGHRWSNPSGWMASMRTAIDAARSAKPSMPIWLHYAGYRDLAPYAAQVKELGADGIGLSYYPWWHGTDLDSLGQALDVIQAQGLGSALFEYMYPWSSDWNDMTHNLVGSTTPLVSGYAASPEGQAEFVRSIRVLAGNHGCWATIYWEPFWLAGSSPVENCAWADFDGRLLPVNEVR